MNLGQIFTLNEGELDYVANISSLIGGMSATRGTNIMRFTAGVNNGMFDVAFYNNGAAKDLNGGKDGSLLAASSFELASTTSCERSSFCTNLLAELTSEVNSAQLAMEMNAYNPDPMVPELNGKNAAQQKQTQAKKQENEDEAEDALYKSYQDNYYNLKTLDQFNSDAAMQFKTLKEASDNQCVLAKKHYYTFNSNLIGGSNISIGTNSNNSINSPDTAKPEGTSVSVNTASNNMVANTTPMMFLA